MALVMRTWSNVRSDIQLLEKISRNNRETHLIFLGSIEVSKTRHSELPTRLWRDPGAWKSFNRSSDKLKTDNLVSQ